MAKTVILNDFSQASIEQLQANLDNMVKEQEQYEKHREHHDSLVKLNEDRLRLKEQMSAISDAENEPINPTYRFQQNPEWIKLHSEFLKIESAGERKAIREEITRLAMIRDMAQSEIDRFKEAIPKIREELAKRGA